jgi:hypothetical protein
MNEKDLRDCFAMFALNGILSCNYDVGEEPAVLAYKYADEMLEARNKDNNEELGIAAVKPKRRYPKRPSDL